MGGTVVRRWWGWALLGLGAIGGAVTAGEAVVLERVAVVPGPAVKLKLSAPLAVAGRTLAAAGGAPERIYFDLPALLGPRVPRVIEGPPPLLRVRVAQRDPSTVRIVLDLEHRVAFSVATTGTRAVVRLDRIPPPQARAAEPDPAAGWHIEAESIRRGP